VLAFQADVSSNYALGPSKLWFGSCGTPRSPLVPRTVLRLVPGRSRSYRQENLHEMHMHKFYLSNSYEISLLKPRDKCGV
jgi:hypothetical protein